jgi:MFS transporter, DHA2 family, multidrug resistance protein
MRPLGGGWRALPPRHSAAVARAVSTFAVYLLVFTLMLDTSVANLALPYITADLGMTLFQASLVMTTFGTGLLIAFALGKHLSCRIAPDLVLSVGAVGFLFTSYACGVAESSSTFLTFRFVQGLFAGVTVINAQGLLLRTLGPENRAYALALWTSAISIAPLCGPVVGSYMTQYFSWRWLFLMNVPMAAPGLLLLLRQFDFSLPAERERGYGPLLTLAFFACAAVGAQYMLDMGPSVGWFRDTRVTLAALVGAAGAAAFLASNHHTLGRVFDLGVFRDVSYAVSVTILCLGNGIIITSILVLGIWLQVDYGMPILVAGLTIAVASGISGILSPLVGKFLPKRHYLFATGLSLFATAVSFWMMTRFGPDTSPGFIVSSRVVAGVGLAVFTVPLTALALANIPEPGLVNAYSITATLRVLIANVFIAVGFGLKETLTHLHYERLVSSVDRATSFFQPSGGPEALPYHPPAIHSQVLASLSYAVALFFTSAVFVWTLIVLYRMRPAITARLVPRLALALQRAPREYGRSV